MSEYVKIVREGTMRQFSLYLPVSESRIKELATECKKTKKSTEEAVEHIVAYIEEKTGIKRR